MSRAVFDALMQDEAVQATGFTEDQVREALRREAAGNGYRLVPTFWFYLGAFAISVDVLQTAYDWLQWWIS